MAKRSSVSSQRVKRTPRNVPVTISNDLTTELAILAAMPDSKIDYSDIPEQLDWSDAVVGKFYRPLKKQVSIRVDIDVLTWFRARGDKGYATRMGQALREYVQAKNAMIARPVSRKANKTANATSRKLKKRSA